MRPVSAPTQKHTNVATADPAPMTDVQPRPADVLQLPARKGPPPGSRLNHRGLPSHCSGKVLSGLDVMEYRRQFAAPAVGSAASRIDGRGGRVAEQPGDGELDAFAVQERWETVGHPWVPGLLDDVFGVDAFSLQLPGGQLPWVRASDRGLGSLTQDPCESRSRSFEVVGGVPDHLPVVWYRAGSSAIGRDTL